MLGLYIHIPFCKHICTYCDFPKKIPKDTEQIVTYLNFLKKEILSYAKYFNDIDTIYIGGGTPNVLSDMELEDFLSFLASLKLNYKEFSIETNPELITYSQAMIFKKYGINRVSLGVQTLKTTGISLLGRHHNEEKVINAIRTLQQVGITNINVDLIYAYFSETLDDLKYDLETIVKENVTHISAYSLILEENTLLNKKHHVEEIDEDLAADMTNYINSFLKKNGYIHYEISNYAKAGYFSLHNLKYWEKNEYIGCGMGATSYLNHQRITNSYYINNYLTNQNKFVEELSLLDEKKEYVIMGLRKMEGIDKNDYYQRFKSQIDNDFNYAKLIEAELLIDNGKSLYLTERGILLGNIVFEEFL